MAYEEALRRRHRVHEEGHGALVGLELAVPVAGDRFYLVKGKAAKVGPTTLEYPEPLYTSSVDASSFAVSWQVVRDDAPASRPANCTGLVLGCIEAKFCM